MERMRNCRTCSLPSPEKCMTPLEDNNLNINLVHLLKRFVPEMKVEVSKPCICYKCLAHLYILHDFRKICLQTEKRIVNYARRFNSQRTHVSLADIFCEEDNLEENGEEDCMENVVEFLRRESMENDEEERVTEQEIETETARPNIVASAQNGKTVTEGEEKPVAVNVLPQSIKGGEDKESGIKNRRRKSITSQQNVDREVKITPRTAAHLVCNICYKSFRSLATLRYHEGNCKKPDLPCQQCEYCEYKGMSHRLLRRHLKRCHSNESFFYMCLHCGFRMDTEKILQQHVRKHEKDGKRLYCKECDFTGCDNESWLDHVTAVHSLSENCCPYCQKCVEKKEALANHMLFVHSLDVGGLTLYRCNYCPFINFIEGIFERHVEDKHLKF